MRHRIALPAQLGSSFAVSDARKAGVGRWRASTPDLTRPFRGIRATSPPDSFGELIRCYLPKMKDHQRFVGRTAMRLWGLPVPVVWHPGEPLEVAVPRESTPPKGTGVRGRRLNAERARTWTMGPARVVDPIAAVFSAAASLSVAQVVCALDAIVTDASNYRGLLPGRPRLSVDDITARLEQWGRFTGCGTVRAAIDLVRTGVESPKETETRLLMLEHGLPEPVVQHEVHCGTRFIARVDLAYVALKIAIEYEEDGHRTDRNQWRRDIQRERELVANGWIVIRLTQEDLRRGAPAFIAHVRHAMASRA